MGLWNSFRWWLGSTGQRHRGIIEQVAAPANLHAALARVIRNARNAGESEAAVTSLARRVGALDQLGRDLQLEAYRPGTIRQGWVPKASGGVRPIAILGPVDRVVQTAAALVLTPLLDDGFSEASFGYRPNRSLADALERVGAARSQGYTVAVEGDISRCFERIRHDRLIEHLRDRIADRALVRLVACWLKAWGKRGRGLPQGAPLSPLLCNVALHAFDSGLAGGPGMLVRYADDFVILCRSRDEAARALSTATALLKAEGLTLSGAKTRVTTFNQGLDFLGHSFLGDRLLRDAAKDPCPDVKARVRARATGGAGSRRR